MGLFKKKPGGTFFGNLIRTAASKASGGFLGTGANMLPADSSTAGRLEQSQQTVDAIKDKLADSPAVKKEVGNAIWNKYKWVFIAAGVGIIVLIILALRPRKKGAYRR